MKYLLFSRRSFGILFFVVLACLVAVPALAAPGGVLTGFSLNAAECYVTITAQVQDEGFYAINVWDDGNFRGGAGTNVPAGGTLTVNLTIGGLILQGAAGIGVYLEDAVGLAATVTYDANGNAQLWSDSVGLDCANRGFTFAASVVQTGNDGCSNPLPAGSAVYSVPDGAFAYYDADPNTSAGFTLPPGTWYISEFGEEFAKVWIACEGDPIYIPIINVVR